MLPNAPANTPKLKPDMKDGGDRTFASLFVSGAPGTYTLIFPSTSTAGSRAMAPNIALLTWPPSSATNLSAALAAMNGLPNNGGTSVGTPTFAPGSSTNLPVSAGTPPTANTTHKGVTPAQQRCLALTGGAPQCQ
jgi:hypothetical protein